MKTCRRCGETKPVEEFHRNRQTSDGRHPWCASCKNAKVKERYHASEGKEREKSRLRQKKWRHGLTEADYQARLLAQGGKCAICGNRTASNRQGTQGLAIDHDHQTGLIRGLLCHPCNMALGLLRDDPGRFLRAAAYLLESQSVQADAEEE